MTRFNPRYTEPSYDNPYYIKDTHGGLNPCILITGDSCIPNCVGYANGRSRELTDNQAEMPQCNAVDWIANSPYDVGTDPKVGAVICWSGGYGHVGVVEAVDDSSITVSQSDFGGTRFFLTHLDRNDPSIPYHPFMGYIYNPYVETGIAIDPVPYGVFRLYNMNTGEHFYSADIDEVNKCANAGWQCEGVAFYHSDDEGVDVYRLYNPAGDHMFTTSASERDWLVSLGWVDEKVAFKTPKFTDKPVYRLYNEHVTIGTHLFTTSTKEVMDTIKMGWLLEGIGFYTN